MSEFIFTPESGRRFGCSFENEERTECHAYCRIVANSRVLSQNTCLGLDDDDDDDTTTTTASSRDDVKEVPITEEEQRRIEMEDDDAFASGTIMFGRSTTSVAVVESMSEEEEEEETVVQKKDPPLILNQEKNEKKRKHVESKESQSTKRIKTDVETPPINSHPMDSLFSSLDKKKKKKKKKKKEKEEIQSLTVYPYLLSMLSIIIDLFKIIWNPSLLNHPRPRPQTFQEARTHENHHRRRPHQRVVLVLSSWIVVSFYFLLILLLSLNFRRYLQSLLEVRTRQHHRSSRTNFFNFSISARTNINSLFAFLYLLTSRLFFFSNT